MKTLLSRFTDHPASVGESYWQHFRMAASFAAAMIGGGLACLVHALFPFLCVTRGSETIARMHERMVTHRRRLHDLAAPSGLAREHTAEALAEKTLRLYRTFD